ncbi:M81 family metallopeptidase [Alicycliphilus denitrificans]|uniref:Microcystinase C n=2 Tax=Alicycliphilus denitrificans TaxID=179636 RepID=F4GBT2_ALIDK|nr:M81 family metallopeptidase [Alicycliphilus denitrificans]AEB87003.1 Microcystin LR degradation protein MlrC [Alicycliphilus denitrificans K601]QKD46168.1 M81 family metallopeptidase [Alicycliphilus denitrificans]
MKILIARLNHETNTFSPVPTPIEAFSPTYGEEAYRANKGMRTAMAAFIELAEGMGATLVTPVSAMANPSGPVHAAAYDELTRRIADAAPGCDAILLDLHGAMVAEHTCDGEGDLLARVRAAAPGVPVGVALDLHGNVTGKMVQNADVMVGFKTYPHIDMYETGEHAGRLLLQMLRGEARFRVCWHRLPLMSHTLRSTTLEGPMRDAVENARALEHSGIPAVSVFGGFSLADIEAPCMSVVATCRIEDAPATQAAVDGLARQIWERRAEYVYRSEPLADSLRRARSLAEGATKPVLLLDHGDNCMSGGTCDTMDVLQAALELGLTGIAVGPLCDPEAVGRLIAAGKGAEVEIDLGNKVPLTSIGLAKQPLRLRGTVRAVSDGGYTVTGPIYTGQRCHMGRTVCLDTGAAQIVVTEQTHEPWDLGVFHCVGLDPTRFRFLLLKSRMYCRPVFVPLSAGLVECDSPGATTSDYARFPFTRVRRPVFPLDAL